MNEIIQAISSVGFPIVCSILLGYLLITEQRNHKEEMLQLKDAINSNKNDSYNRSLAVVRDRFSYLSSYHFGKWIIVWTFAAQ